MSHSVKWNVLLCIAASACSAGPLEPVDHTEGAVTSTAPNPSAADAGASVTNCLEVSCPPPPPEWCESDRSETPLPAWLVAYWNLSCATCGDGILDEAEVCDDGNGVAGDGCSADCASIETGFACAAPGAPCE
jgi:cysteine-rich repeat protein